MRSLVSSALACALSFAAGACQFDSTPLPVATGCGPATGTECTTTNAASSGDAGVQLDPGTAQMPAQMPIAAQASMPVTPPAQPPIDAGAGIMQPAARDAGSQRPPEHDADAVAMPSDPDASGSTSDAALPDAAMPDTSAPGQAFEPCTVHSECATGLYCTADPSTGAAPGTRGYCTAACGAGGWTGSGNTGATPDSGPFPCLQPSSGSVTASCQFPGLCLLDTCDAGHKCPDALECVQTQAGMVVSVSTCQVSAAP